MNANLIKSYLKEMPAVICTAGSYIAAKNSEAEKQLRWLSKDGKLFDHMSAEYILKYEANFARSLDGDIFLFSLKGPDGEWHAIAVFDSICSRRFSGVFFFKEKKSAESFARAVPCILSKNEKIAFASVLLEIPEESFEPLDKSGLIDIRSSTLAVMQKLEGVGVFADFSENPAMKEAACIPVDIHLINYLQMALLMILAAKEISEDCGVSVKLCRYGDVAELRVLANLRSSLYGYATVDELMRNFGEAIPYISVCKYIAGISDCIFDVKTSEVGVTILISINEKKYMDVDFKSRDTLRYFEECYSFAKRYALLLGSGNTKQ